MTTRILLGLFLLVSVNLFANSKADTTIVEFTDKQINKRVTVHTSANKTVEIPISLDLNSLLKEMGIDSNERRKTLMIITSNENSTDTLLLINRDGQKIRIIAKEPRKILKALEENEPDSEEDAIADAEDAESDEHDHDEDEDDNDTHAHNPKHDKPQRYFSKSDFGIYLGLNNFAKGTPGGADEMYDLRTWKSRYIALSFRKNATLLRGEHADLALSYGPEIAWYNFMFTNSNTAKMINDQVVFRAAEFNTQKSKLVVPYVNFPVMFNIGTKQDKFKFGFGGYVGYRFGAYTKTKDLDGDKQKVKNDYGLNDLIYGITAEMGRKNSLTIFFRYDLNNTFKSDQQKLKDIQAFSFGIRI